MLAETGLCFLLDALCLETVSFKADLPEQQCIDAHISLFYKSRTRNLRLHGKGENFEIPSVSPPSPSFVD